LENVEERRNKHESNVPYIRLKIEQSASDAQETGLGPAF
jgi:hypothetical protein